MEKVVLTREKHCALQKCDKEKARELDARLLELEAKAEDAEKRRYEGGASCISAISYINTRNRKNNIMKAEMAIKEDIKRKEVEGFEDNPFTRRKCRPGRADAIDGRGREPAKKKAKMSAGAEGGGSINRKEDLFSYHDFDIDIPSKCRTKLGTLP